ncbi:helicase domino isoform X2 [Plodia interpunctella]|uniref:helicase domino isoform X2 n=1 Tax=Plodia interpunctella TaxID=58824 RepID=UPI0023683AD8|nr:helicase domino isoform X2 [Plodia interpunctella]
MSGRDESAVLLGVSSTHQSMGVERVVSGGGATAATVALNGAPPDRREEPPRKKIKMSPEDVHALRSRILDCEALRQKSLRERITEQLSELYFLQAGGNMMDYAAWRKRPPAPQLLAFLEARRPAPVTTPTPPPPPAPAVAADEVLEKAKQEAVVARRVAELARAGLWAERRLPRVLEPPRAKTHWDYLLEEMAWLAQDFAYERKWKKQAAKKCARAIQKYFQDKATAAQKAEKAQELQLRKIAAFAAKEIRTFWSNVEKLVEWKRVKRVERARKEALDEQLSYIVDRTERYSRQLAANLHAPARAGSDDEFQPRGESSDDEETIAAAERDAPDHRDEIDALRRESRLALADLLPPGYLAQPYHSPPPSDYAADDDSADDESTIAEQERAESPRDADDELAALKRDADLSVDELVRQYGGAAAAPVDSDDDSDDAASSTSASSSSASEALEALMEQPSGAATDGGAEGGEERVQAWAQLAASLQPTGTTLSETAVGTPVPRLLKHPLREYQHVGLHWLATMHARALNGILADEMGLGKTIQTIALLAHLAERGCWGPHLVVAPTSVVLNWEMEFKKWCPAFKILTYYGTIKERKLKRVGWTKANSFHVCITSYKLVVQDHQSFRRKRWKYLILDEAQNIKNFKSQRWQMLLNFQTERRLLLTGTPLQNSLLELWSLMHFLMPDVFASHSEFREWFGELGAEHDRNDALVRRLHEVLRPFLLRRLKADVERQMPRKYEHVLLCRLAKRQRCLYDDFMARARTKESLASGNLLSVINVLMQLRKVCNHPDLFEPRPVCSPLALAALRVAAPAVVLAADVARRAALAARLGGDLATLEANGADALAAHRARHLAPPRRLLEELGAARARPRPPPAALRLHLRLVARANPAANAAPAPPPRPLSAHPAPHLPPPPSTPAPGPALARLELRRRVSLRRLAAVNERRCWRLPLYGADLRAALAVPAPPAPWAPLAPLCEGTLNETVRALIDRFSVCCAVARAPAPVLVAGAGAGPRAWRRAAARLEAGAAPRARALLALLHAPASRQAVAFPHPSLLQYDCGKLQTLDSLLRTLKAGKHRVLIFTQMTRVLDVLEAFLSLHGHAYLRLDGATRVEQRQALVERFNADPRVFAFILSTRSGGVGLNLTGADCVVFYDSDWNPTMDAQAQDRCHRIGQTRDVHVYRLVTAATVEENILRKAEQKRALGHLAIEHGNFTTSYLRASNIKELFGAESPASAEAGAPSSGSGEGELESALAAAEDEADAAAARAARAEQQTELAEFDETLPLPDDEPDRADPEADRLMNQLTPIEKYAMRMVESSEAATEAERAALGEMRRQLREWEDARRLLREESPPAPAPAPAPALTYPRPPAASQVWITMNGGPETMPMWSPPTPPSGDGDVYCDSWARALYRRGAAPDCLLPAARPRDPRDPRAAREPRRARPAPRAPLAPPSLFERGGARPRARARLPAAPHAHHAAPAAPDWGGCEDAALRRALRLQRLPPEPPAALAPNWDWVSDALGDAARAYRSARACRDRHDALADPERARRKHRRAAAARRRQDDDALRPPLARFEAMREAAERRRAAPKRRLDDPQHPNPKHAALLADHGVDYDTPPSPMEVASRRAERIAKEKLKAGAPAGPSAPPAAAAPQRIVVATHATHAAAQAAKSEAVRRAKVAVSAAPAASVAVSVAASVATPQLLYRQQQALAARHQLKILHAGPQHGQVSSASGGEASGAALRALQLRRAGPVPTAVAAPRTAGPGAAPRPAVPAPRLLARHSHVLVTQLAPAPAPAPRPPDSRQ